MSTTTTQSHARIARKLRGRPASDGAGVKLTRVIGSPELDMLDPFLLLDEFGTDRAEDYLAGFPDHPHRGFETVTYMLDGRMRHRDNHGNEGLLVPGSVQWMTAGRGLVHSEMPEQQERIQHVEFGRPDDARELHTRAVGRRSAAQLARNAGMGLGRGGGHRGLRSREAERLGTRPDTRQCRRWNAGLPRVSPARIRPARTRRPSPAACCAG